MNISLGKILIVIFLCVFMMFTISYHYKEQEMPKEYSELVTEISYEQSEISNIIEEKNEDTKTSEISAECESVVDNASVFYLSDYERQVAECIVMGESGGESYEGQVLVAQCLLNACLRDDLQPSDVREKYKYSGWNSNPSESVKNAVSSVFDDGYKITDEFILYFYAPEYTEGDWHETQVFVTQVGGHRFFSETTN